MSEKARSVRRVRSKLSGAEHDVVANGESACIHGTRSIGRPASGMHSDVTERPAVGGNGAKMRSLNDLAGNPVGLTLEGISGFANPQLVLRT
jgi:hypothetical protein